jgi:hypothetical protein
MAELNFGLLTPPGSQSIGNAFVQGMDQAAVARARENQNALSQYTLSKARREDELTNQLLGDLRNAKTPQEQAYAYARAGKPKEGSDLLTGIATRQNLEARTGASRASTATSKFDLAQKRTNKAIIDISNLPDSETALSSIDRHLAAGDIDEAKATALKAELGNPETFIAGRTKIIMGMLEAKDRLPYEKTTTRTTPLGNVSREQREDAFGRPIGLPTDTPIGVSANTKATLAQAQQHFNGLSAYQKEQLRVQGKQFDSDRGVIVDVKKGTFEPVYSYPSSTPFAPAAPAAPAAIPTAPSAAPAGTPITQPRGATAGTFPRVTPVQQTNRMEGATAIRRQELANEQNALENARQKLASPAAANDPDIRRFYEERFKEATSNIADLNKELGNQPAQPSATQPAQRTVLGPKPSELQKTEIELNKQYTSESKGFIETKIAIDKAKAALKDAATNPTAGLSAGTAFMKILDPQSVVRETELAMALKSSGWFDSATNVANTLQSGKTILTPTQITNLNKTIDGLFEEVKAEQRIVDAGYTTRAKSYGLDIKNIITDRGQNKKAEDKKLPANAPPIESFRIRRP